MSNKKSNQNPGNKPEPVNGPVGQVEEKPDETAEETTETTEEKPEETTEETTETTEEKPEETTEETTETTEEKPEETTDEKPEEKPVHYYRLEDTILLCETAISAKGSSMKWLREVYCKIEKDPQKRVNLANLGDSPAARQHIIATAQEFLKKCTKK